MQQSDWADAGQGCQGKEATLRLQGWSRQRRIILSRRKLGRDLAMTDRLGHRADAAHRRRK